MNNSMVNTYKKISFRIRFVATLAITVALLGFISSRLPTESKYQGGRKSQFWREKRSWSNCADIVISGDSRSYRGIIPAEMQYGNESNLDILNFGFSAVAFTEDYLVATKEVLKDNGARIILLGITPNSLTLGAARENGFTQTSQDLAAQSVAAPAFAPILEALSPMHPRSFLNAVFGIQENWRTRDGYYQDFQVDGSIPSTRVPEVPDSATPFYEELFSNNQVSEELIRDLLTFVSECSNSGIAVFALRVPTSEEVYNIEERESGFDQENFVKQFEFAGGEWLNIPTTGYQTYDGNHVHSNSAATLGLPRGEHYSNDAAALSRKIGKMIIPKSVINSN
ncbi:hypothetical protein N8669_00960 [bacterium]|nr:hypothetical protein [bacterium]